VSCNVKVDALKETRKIYIAKSTVQEEYIIPFNSGQWFATSTLVSSTNITYIHDNDI
jgi:hypothetical protein